MQVSTSKCWRSYEEGAGSKEEGEDAGESQQPREAANLHGYVHGKAPVTSALAQPIVNLALMCAGERPETLLSDSEVLSTRVRLEFGADIAGSVESKNENPQDKIERLRKTTRERPEYFEFEIDTKNYSEEDAVRGKTSGNDGSSSLSALPTWIDALTKACEAGCGRGGDANPEEGGDDTLELRNPHRNLDNPASQASGTFRLKPHHFALPANFWRFNCSLSAIQYESLDIARTGDILLFRTRMKRAAAQRFFTGLAEHTHTAGSISSAYDHVAMALRLKSGRVGILEAKQPHGVTILYWEDFLARTPPNMYHRVAVRQIKRLRAAGPREQNENPSALDVLQKAATAEAATA